MRIIHLADLHIGKSLYGYSLLEDQRYILKNLIEEFKRLEPDAIVIAGDIYDKSIPPAAAVALFDEFLSDIYELQIKIMVIAGNHDSGERLDFAKDILKRQGLYIAGNPPMTGDEYLQKIKLEDEYGEVYFYLCPFTKPAHIRNFTTDERISYHKAFGILLDREPMDTAKRNVLVSHQFFVSSGQKPETSDSEIVKVGGIDEIDICVIKDFDYVALGHIHKAQSIGYPHIRYAGSPMKYSLSELHHTKTFTVIDIGNKVGEKAELEITEVEIRPLRELIQRKGSLEEIVKTAKQEDRNHLVSIILTDEEEHTRPRDILDQYYTNILEVRVENARTERMIEEFTSSPIQENLSLQYIWNTFFMEFQGRQMSEDEEAAFERIWNAVLEENDETD